MALEPLATVGGGELLARLALSPTALLVAAAVLVAAGLGYLRSRGRGVRLLTVAAAVLAVALVALLAVATVRPWQEYGLYLDEASGEAVLRYMAGSEARAPLCGSRVELLSVDEALGLLSRRDLGVSDPFSGVHLGVYTLQGGVRGYVLLLEDAGEAVLVEAPDGRALLAGLSGARGAYEALLEAKSRLCPG